MNTIQKRIVAAVHEHQPASFAALSFDTQMATGVLSGILDDLEARGFVQLDGGCYTLPEGVRDHFFN